MPARATAPANRSGDAKMVDVSEKPLTRREAVAVGEIRIKPGTLTIIRQGRVPKGDVFSVAKIAGLLAAKRVPDLIPLTHPLAVEHLSVDLELKDDRIAITATAKFEGKTGLEMEALTAVAVAALTVYDMCKPLDKDMVIGPIYLVKKSGGRSGIYVRTEPPAGALDE